jgi:hypothetical protein
MSHSKALSILTLFLLNVGCLAANSPMRRSMSVDADGKTKTELQSLIELANILPGEETEATQSLLMLTEATLPGASKDEMLGFIKNLKSNVTSWYSDATARLEKSIGPIRQCDDTKKERLDQSLTQKGKCAAKSESHISCRTEESKLLTAMEHLKAQMAEKKEIMDTECKIFSDVEAEAKAATASYGGGDEESYLERVCDEFGGLLPRYEDAKKKCTTAKAEYARVSALYEIANTKYTLQVKTCNAIQIKLDVVCCKYALVTKDTCESYGTCHEEKVAEHNSLKEALKREEKVQEVAWRVFTRIECLLPLLGTDDHAGIEACREKVHASPHSIGEPVIPDPAECAVEEAYPGTDGYYKAHYANLPENAKGEAVAQCVGMATGMATEDAWEWKWGNNGCARCDDWCPHGSVDNINYGGRGEGKGRSCANNDGSYPCGNEVAGDNGACHQCKCWKQAPCKAKSTSTADAGYGDNDRGWYDVQGCGKCLDYCRWVGNSGSGGSPHTKLTHGSSWWSCRLAGDSSAYSSKSHFSSWSHKKCSGEGADAP